MPFWQRSVFGTEEGKRRRKVNKIASNKWVSALGT